MTYLPVIGLEIHAELTTKSKLFCRCANTSSDLQTPPNTAVCPVCLGLPGALPVLNEAAVAATIKLGQSLGSTIPTVTKWDRKNYFYPDLPKGYQISQYDEPLCSGGELLEVKITRVHLEEDTGKLVHPNGANYSLIDYNRSSIPLLELVTEPVITSAQQAKQFAKEYQLQLRDLNIAEANMEKGEMRCEANISVVPEDWAHDPAKRLTGTKVEVKNLNSFRSLERAIGYEIDRQTNLLNSGGTVIQETRGWNEAKGETYVMRSKETADDYRYFPEPDLGQLHTNVQEEEMVTKQLPTREELKKMLRDLRFSADFVDILYKDKKRYMYYNSLSQIGLPEDLIGYAVGFIVMEPKIVEIDPQSGLRILEAYVNKELPPSGIKELVYRVHAGNSFIDALSSLKESYKISDLDTVVNKILGNHSQEVARYKAGEGQLFGYFVGQVRKELAGKGDPGAIAEELKKQLQ